MMFRNGIRNARVGIFLGCAVICQIVFAEPDKMIRMEYAGDKNMPDNISTAVFFYQLEKLNSAGSSYALNHLKMFGGLEKDEASEYLTVALDLGSRMNVELDETLSGVICTHDRWERSRETVIRMLDALDDLKLAVYQKYYVLLETVAPRGESKATKKLIDHTKLSTTFTQVNHAEWHKDSSDEELQNMFNQYCAERGA